MTAHLCCRGVGDHLSHCNDAWRSRYRAAVRLLHRVRRQQVRREQLVRVPRAALVNPPMRGRAPTHWVSGGRTPLRKNRARGGGGIVPPGIKVCSDQQRRRTPLAFAEWLVAMARSVTRDQAELALEVG